MGKIKETQSEVFQGRITNSESGFIQPTFTGLLEIIRGFQYEKSAIFNDQNSTSEDQTVFEGSEYFSNEQLHFRGSEANVV